MDLLELGPSVHRTDEYIITAGGKKFFFFRPAGSIFITDIAHALANVGERKDRSSWGAVRVRQHRVAGGDDVVDGSATK